MIPFGDVAPIDQAHRTEITDLGYNAPGEIASWVGLRDLGFRVDGDRTMGEYRITATPDASQNKQQWCAG